MLPLQIEIPKHIRKVQFSAKQRPVYFEWNGVAITGKKRKLHQRWFININEEHKFPKIEDLKDKFYIGLFKNNKLTYVTRDSSELPSAADLLKTKDKYRLVVKEESDSPKEDYTLILCNPKIVNTPKLQIIKGQDFYSGNVREHQRAAIMNAIKDCFRQHMVSFPVITEYPVRIICEVHDTIKNSYDNQAKGLGRPWDIDNYAYPYMKAFPDLLKELGKLKDDDRLHVTQPPSAIFCPVKNHEDRKLVFIISKDDRKIIAEDETYKNYHQPSEPENPIETAQDNQQSEIF